MVKLPEVGFINPQSIEISVVLPAPLGPNKPNISPLFTTKDKALTEKKSASLYFLERDCISITGLLINN
jgi:hypothetical protein